MYASIAKVLRCLKSSHLFILAKLSLRFWKSIVSFYCLTCSWSFDIRKLVPLWFVTGLLETYACFGMWTLGMESKTLMVYGFSKFLSRNLLTLVIGSKLRSSRLLPCSSWNDSIEFMASVIEKTGWCPLDSELKYPKLSFELWVCCLDPTLVYSVALLAWEMCIIFDPPSLLVRWDIGDINLKFLLNFILGDSFDLVSCIKLTVNSFC